MTSQLPGTEWAHNAAPPSARPSTPLHPSPWPHGVSLSLSTPGQWHTNAGSDDGTAERATKRQKVDNRGHSRAPSTATSTHTPTAYFDTSILTQGDEESATDRHQPATERSFHETSVKTRGGEPKARLHLPLPPRPPSRATRTAGVTHRGPTGRSKLPVQIQPYLPEVPARAPRFDGAKPADYHPWTGHHPEDVISESSTKNGFYDRLSSTQSESTTARPSIWSSLKHKSGLQVLSSLFGTVLAQRQLHCTITAASTFKPPPRVTLTDAKREIWLKDLANPAIPLRRLSRTIPHGIRGKSLLDHCLSKKIPVPRAVWLAKCVGANEIRAFKRKGTAGVFAVGGEAKWIKEWSANVEQFVESVLTPDGSSEWGTSITYSLRLTARLFSQRLLDEEHYLDWIVQGIRNADSDKLSLWLLLLKMHQGELLTQRRHGGHLVASLLKHLHKYNDSPDRQVNVPVINLVTGVLRDIILKSPSNFISPSHWKEHLMVLRTCFDGADLVLHQALDHVADRNEALAFPVALRTGDERCRHRQTYIKKLDGIVPHTNLRRLLAECTELTREHDTLIHTTLEWGASVYRQGKATVYKATRLLRLVSKLDIDLTHHILNFLTRTSTMPGLDRRKLYRILGELFRSQHLAVGKYLQWIIACGLDRRAVMPHHPRSCQVGLLHEIPLSGLPEHVISLRGTLLGRLGLSVEEEVARIANLKLRITQSFDSSEALNTESLISLITPELSQTIRSDLACWIRTTLLSHWGCYDKKKRSDRSKIAGESSLQNHMNRHDLKKVIRVVEILEDYSILADILRASALYGNLGHLHEAVECVNLHFETFAAIGASANLATCLLQTYREWQNLNTTNVHLLEALHDLASRIPSLTKECDALHQSISISKQKNSVMACSPVSDHVAEALQTAEENFADGLEQALASGTTMDSPTMKQLLDLVMDRYALSWAFPKSEDADFPEMLHKLRQFDQDSFNTLFNERLQRVLSVPNRPDLCKFIPYMVSAKCTTLGTVVDLVAESLQSLQDYSKAASLAIDGFNLLTLGKLECDPECYGIRPLHRFFDEQQKIISAPTPPVVMILSAVLGFLNPSGGNTHAGIVQRMRRLTSIMAVHHPQALDRLSLFDARPSCFLVLPAQPSIEATSGKGSTKDKIDLKTLLAATDDFNGPIILPLLDAHLSTLEGEATGQLLDTLINSATENPQRASATWTRLVASLDERRSSALQEKAELRLLSHLPEDLRMTKEIGNAPQVMTLLSIIATTKAQLDVKVASSIMKQTLDTFALAFATWRSQGNTAPTQKLEHTLNILLSIFTLHLPSVGETSFPQSLLHDAMVVLSILLTNSPIASSSRVSRQLNDLLIVLSDSLHDDTRARLLKTRQTLPTPTDSRLNYILGTLEPKEDHWLQLVSDAPLPAASSSASGKSSDAPHRVSKPFPLKQWEMMQDATPLMGENDTSLSLTLFGARKVIP